MKASINGITIEGTPQEIMEYQRLVNAEATRKPYPNPHDTAYNPIIWTLLTCDTNQD